VIEYLVQLPGININPLDRCCCTPLDGEYLATSFTTRLDSLPLTLVSYSVSIDAIRENKPAIASILRSAGGLVGKDAKMVDAQRLHKQARARFLAQKQIRREGKIAVFQKQQEVLQRLMEVYKLMSENLPTLCKYINLLR